MKIRINDEDKKLDIRFDEISERILENVLEQNKKHAKNNLIKLIETSLIIFVIGGVVLMDTVNWLEYQFINI